MKFAIAQIIVWTAACGFGLGACSGDCDGAPAAKDAPGAVPAARPEAPPDEDSDVAGAKQLVTKAYALKQDGKNRAALSLFEQAHAIYADKKGKDSFEVASSLDDQASVHMRLGDYARAVGQYEEARRILTGLKGDTRLAQRLLEGIDFRLSLLAALKERNIACAEPAEPIPTPDRGTGGSGAPEAGFVPYFPDVDEVHRELAELNHSIQGCIKGKPSPVLVRIVITGKAEVVIAEVTGPKKGTESARCIEDDIRKAALSAHFPRFGACFRQFNYLFKVGKP